MRRRRAGRSAITVRRGDMVVDAYVRARLLGLPLLELDARVVVAPQRGDDLAAAARDAATLPANGRTPEALGRAVRLLAEGERTLQAARRIG